MWSHEAVLMGVALFHASDEDMAECREYVCAGIQAGTIRPHVGYRFPLAHATQAFEQLLHTSTGARGKVVLLVE